MNNPGQNTTMELSFRKATHGDAGILRSLSAALGAQPQETRAHEEAFARILSTPGVDVWLVRAGIREVGTFVLGILPTLGTRCRPLAIVDDVIVLPDLQGKGLGRAMMSHAMQLAREAGCYKLMLSSNLSRGQAHGFYEALGFERHGYSFVVDLD